MTLSRDTEGHAVALQVELVPPAAPGSWGGQRVQPGAVQGAGACGEARLSPRPS